MPLKVVKDIIPHPTNVYHIEGTGPLVYLIPGNPGLSEFYTLYLDEIKANTPDLDLELLCPSHRGLDTKAWHSYNLNHGDPTLSLDQQVEHKVTLLKNWVANSNSEKRDVIILSHSVGAWMAQRVSLAFQNDPVINIKFVGLLTPTVANIAKSDRGRSLIWCDQKIGYMGSRVGRFSEFLSWLIPRSVIESLLYHIIGKDNQNNPAPKESIHAALELVTKPKIVKQALDMGTEEMYRILSDLEPEDIQGFWENEGKFDKLWLYYVKNDHWVDNDTRAEIIDKYGNDQFAHIDIEIEKREYITHSFCVHYSQEVAEVTARKIMEVFA